MAEPSKWAMGKAREIFRSWRESDTMPKLHNDIAIALDAARREGITECLRIFGSDHAHQHGYMDDGPNACWHDSVFAAKQAVAKLLER